MINPAVQPVEHEEISETGRTKGFVLPVSGKLLRRRLATLLVLFKFRIVLLLLFAAVAGAFLASGGWPGGGTLGLLLLTGGLAASGASALNQYLEKRADALMLRTRTRPLVNGSLSNARWVPWLASGMILVPSLAVLPSNPALAFFLLAGAAIYLGIYTLWLKPRTLLNIVIGGAAGSAAVLSGSAAAGAWDNPGAIALALLVFLWTPTHFWALAIVYREDYARGGIPMLPGRTGPRHAVLWMLLHTLATGLAALLLVGHPGLGLIYLLPVGAATVVLIGRNLRLLLQPDKRQALSFFKSSNLYLALVLLMVCVDTLVK